MVYVPPAAVVVNNDLVPSVQEFIERQLFINITQTGEEFAQTISQDGYFIDNVRRAGKRLLVIRDARDTTSQDLFDVVLFFKNGLISVAKNNFGPPGETYLVPTLTWGKLCVFDIQLGFQSKPAYYSNSLCKSGKSDLFRTPTGTWQCLADGTCVRVDMPLAKSCCQCFGFPYSNFRSLANTGTQRQPGDGNPCACPCHECSH